MDWSVIVLLLIIFGLLINVVGVVGAVVPVLPGPPVSFVGMVLCCIACPHPLMITATALMLVLVIVVTVIDYVTPAWLTDKAGGCKKASWGATIGLFIGLIFFMPWGLIVCPFLGAFIGEYWESSDWKHSLSVSAYSLLSLVIGTLFKLVTCLAMLFLCIACTIVHYVQAV